MRTFAACALVTLSLHSAELPFAIRVLDDQTGRGVPLVELRTFSESRYFTDSNGIAAISDPWLFHKDVFFAIRSHGYEFLDYAFGDEKSRGKTVRVVPGRRIDLKIRRRNIAERLYRVTGAGIYRDTVLTGLPAPIRQPLLNAQVTGQDTVVAIPYAGRIFWIWGDTFGLSRMLFAVSAATSEFPGRGGLDPSVGIDLNYFTGPDGFSKAMLPLPRKGLVWIEGLLTVRDPGGRERLVATYTRQSGLTPPEERGVAVFDDRDSTFHVLAHWPDSRHHISSHPFRHVDQGQAYWYLYPHHRVRDDWSAIQNPRAYQTYTSRDGWKSGPAAAAPDKDLMALIDVETGKPALAGPGSVSWNPYRKKWIMIFGRSGSVYYSEAPRPEGPWASAVRIVSHDEYNFYNPAHHPFFDQDGGRIIYFEGTYTDAFTNAKEKTPLYNYNQIMYRLRLDDRRLVEVFPSDR